MSKATPGKKAKKSSGPIVMTSKEPADRKSNQTVLKALIIGGSNVPASKVEVDQWASVSDSTITPPFDPIQLSELPEYSSVLGPCIEALVVNTTGFGYRVIPAVRNSMDEGVEGAEEIKKEIDEATNFFSSAYIGGTSFDQLRAKTRRDKETIGYAYWEVIRDMEGRVSGFNYIPAREMRIGLLSDEPIKVTRSVQRMSNGSVSTSTQIIHKRLRTYCQRVGLKKVWFKEYGDPRIIDPTNGTVNDELSRFNSANEVIYWPLLQTRSVYGIPRYIGNLLAITGSRSRDEMCYYLLRNNNVPALALLVSNGSLTKPTIDRIQEFLDDTVKGEGSFAKVVIIEAESAFDGFEGTANMKMEMKPLIEAQHTDSMFGEYDKENHMKILRSFRLPPIFIGSSNDYNRATADTSRKLADEQVFAPERTIEESMINQLLLDMGFVHARFRANGPNITNNEDIVNVMNNAERSGGMTPALSRAMLEDIMGQDLGEVTGIDPDIPFSAQMAEIVKNLGKTNEPSQQVTAYKQLMDMFGIHSEVGKAIFGEEDVS